MPRMCWKPPKKMDEVQQLYLKFPIDLTEALARTGW